MVDILTPTEARVLGCLIEKALSTPEYYPLSLNALTNACNQKNNRDPVLSVSEDQVFSAIKSLIAKQLVRTQHTSGSRVEKYAHTLSGRLTEIMDFNKKELALMAELLLRGPQTPGELRTRTPRMYDFKELDEISATLSSLQTRQDGPFVQELPRQPGRRENRYRELFTEACEKDDTEQPTPRANKSANTGMEQRITMLEEQVAQLQLEIATLKERIP